MSNTGKPKPPVDQEKVELLYRAGVLTLREIGKECGCSHTRVRELALRHGWVRDLRLKIVARAEEKVARAVAREVAKPLSKPVPETPDSSQVVGNTASPEGEEATVEAGGEALANIKLRHHRDLRGLLEETASMAAELKAMRENLGPLSEWVSALAQDMTAVERSELAKNVQRALGLAGRVAIAKSLSETVAKLIPLERQAWGLDEAGRGNATDYEKLRDEVLDADGNPRE